MQKFENFWATKKHETVLYGFEESKPKSPNVKKEKTLIKIFWRLLLLETSETSRERPKLDRIDAPERRFEIFVPFCRKIEGGTFSGNFSEKKSHNAENNWKGTL